MTAVLKIESASKSFDAPEGGKIHALKDVSLTIAHNEFLTLLGPGPGLPVKLLAAAELT